MPVTYPENIRQVVTMPKNIFPPGKSYFARTKAAMLAITRWPKVPTAVISTVLIRYRLKGTQLCPMVTNRSEKLSVVGCCGHTGGGNRNSSSSGFREDPTRKSSGNTIRNPTITSIR